MIKRLKTIIDRWRYRHNYENVSEIIEDLMIHICAELTCAIVLVMLTILGYSLFRFERALVHTGL